MTEERDTEIMDNLLAEQLRRAYNNEDEGNKYFIAFNTVFSISNESLRHGKS